MIVRATPDITEKLRDHIRRDVASGFKNAKAIEESAIDFFREEVGQDVLERLVPHMVREQVAAHSQEQQAWPAVTDCDRLDAAFAELTKNGIVSRQNFTCCGPCGCAEIGAEINKERLAGIKPRGYAFYHQQDTESAAGGYGLGLNYGDLDGDKTAAVTIAQEVVQTLQRHGLKTEWNGKNSQRIVVNLDWKRRFAP